MVIIIYSVLLITLLTGMSVAIVHYLAARGPRLVTCPATRRPARVVVNSWALSLPTVFGRRPRLHIHNCSNWPKRSRCSQACLGQIESTPDGCMVKAMVTRWYREKPCVYCKKVFHDIDWLNQPALLDDNRTQQWCDVRIEDLPEVLHRSEPVCWNCHITESFRREHPNLVTLRPSA